MKILIFGAGGVGSVFGGFFARMGHEVFLLGRRRHLDVIRKEGLLITGLWGDYRIKAFEFYESAAEISKKNIPFDLIFLTVKSFDTETAANELPLLMNENTTLVSFQNGLGNIEAILKKIKPEQFLVGRVIFGVETRPGVAQITVAADATTIGALPGAAPRMSPEKLAHHFNLCKIEAMAVPNILTYIWTKAVYHCALNGLCALREIPYEKILKNEETAHEMSEIVRECYAVAEKKNIAMEPASADAYIGLLAKTLIPRTAAHFPSMPRDLKKGKRIDIDALNGAISRLGQELGIPTPVNQKITELIQEKNKQSE